MPRYLDDISALYQAAVATGLTASREALFAGLDPGFVAGLPVSASPSAQLLTDLNTLNTIDALTDGTVPLRTWLANAQALTSPRRESAVFQRALDRITAPATGGVVAPPPTPPTPSPWGTKLTGPELKDLCEALLSAFPSRQPLAQMLLFGLSKNLEEIASASNMKDTVFQLVTAAQAQGWISQLFDAALAEVPGNPALRAIDAKRRA